MLGFLICVVALIALRNRRKWYLHSMIALIASGSLAAQSEEKTLLVLLSDAPDAPTPRKPHISLSQTPRTLKPNSTFFIQTPHRI